MSSITPVIMFAILAGSAAAGPAGHIYSESGYQSSALFMALTAAVALTLLFTVFSARKLRTSRPVPSNTAN